MKKTFKIEIEVAPEDFYFMDLHDAIIDGAENIGNYDILGVKEKSDEL